MTSYVALLRGVNVGGRTLPMAELRDSFAVLGYDDVQTYIQSGNVVFKATASPTKIRTAVEERLTARFGPGISVVLRSGAQLADIIRHNPLMTDGRDPAKLHVTFLGSKPSKQRIDGLDARAFLPDEFRVKGGEVYVHCPDGYGRTKINNAFFERALAVVATTRNWNTVTKLAGMAG